MLALKLGPIALPVAPLLWLAALWCAHALATRLARRGGGGDIGAAAAGRAVWRSALLGLVGARLAFIASAHRAYVDAPLLMLDIRDGGWSPVAGVAVALTAAAWHGWRAQALRHPLTSGFAAGGAVWLALAALTGQHQREPLPALALADLRGAAVDLAEAARGAPAVVNLWATWCAPCRTEMPLLAAAQQRAPGVRFLFVNQGEPAATVQRYLQQQPFALATVLLDEASALGPRVGSGGLPTTLFYDAQGRLVARHMGLLSSASLVARLAELGAH